MEKKHDDEFDDNNYDASDDLGIHALFEKARDGGEAPAETDDERQAKKLFELYMQGLGRCEPISAEEADELVERIRKGGDREARCRLIEGNLRLAFNAAKRFRNTVDQRFLDLVQEGNMSLVETIGKFDPERGAKFSTYAAPRIHGYMLNYLKDSHSLVKIGGENLRKLFFNLNKALASLAVQGLEPDPKLIAEMLDVKESEVVEMIIRMSNEELTLDAPLRDGSDEDRVSRIAAEGPSVEDTVDELMLKARLNETIAAVEETLDDRERALLYERLYTADPAPLQKIADEFGITRERARQIEKKLKNKLRRVIEQDMPDLFDFLDGGEIAPAKSGRRVNRR